MNPNKSFLLLLLLLCSLQASAFSLSVNLEYGTNEGMDSDNDGTESRSGKIDFTVNESIMHGMNKDSVCTRWMIYSIETDETQIVCHGKDSCCSSSGLPVQSPDWNDDFLLDFGANTYSLSNSILAQIVYYNESTGLTNSTSWQLLTATFSGSVSFIQLNTTNATVTITSPDNISSFSQIALNVSINKNASLLYTIDNGSLIGSSGNYNENRSDFFFTLNGSLSNGVFTNGNHVIFLEFSEGSKINYSFWINDSAPPVLTSTFNTSILLSQKSILMNISTNEPALISSSLIKSWNHTEGILNISLENGRNEFTIPIQDMNNNSINYSLFLNVSINIANCTDGIQNYHDAQNETGLDCGGACSACVALTLSADKTQYALGELAYIRVTARSDATHNITVNAPDYYYSLTYSGSTYYILSPPRAANYSMNVSLNYKGVIESRAASFEVKPLVLTNPLSVSITANKTTILNGDYIQFNASVSANISATTYTWDFDTDLSNESTASSIIRIYNASGRHNVTLYVTDGTWNKTAYLEIDVRDLYRITFSVNDSETALALDAEISLGNEKQNTTAGTAVFDVKEGSYSYIVSAPEYDSVSGSLAVTRNATISISMKKKKIDALLLTIIAPANNSIVDNTNTFRYIVSGENAACTLSISNDNEIWKEAAKNNLIGETQFIATLPNGTSYWKITCTDSKGRVNTSEVRIVEINANALYVDLEQKDKEYSEVILLIDQNIESLKEYETKEQDIIEDMQLEKYLRDLRKEVERANRDLHNLKWRRLNQTEQVKLERELVKKVDQAKGKLITDIKVAKSSEFVNYPKESDIELVTSKVYAKDYEKLDMKLFNEKNLKLQSYLTVTTEFRTVDITYPSGEKTYAVITKKMVLAKNLSEDTIMYEIIPKEFSDNVSKITFLFEHQIVEYDPIISFSSQQKTFTYYAESEAGLSDANKAKTLMLSEKLPLKKSNQISGNAILGPLQVKVDTRVMIEILILLLLIVFYFAFSKIFGGVDKNLAMVNKKLTAATSSIVSGDYESSKNLYAEIRQVFTKLKPEARKRLYPVITELSHKIDVLFIKKKLVEANLHVASNPALAHTLYADISLIYKRLPEIEKKTIHPECADLNAKIAKALQSQKQGGH